MHPSQKLLHTLKYSPSKFSGQVDRFETLFQTSPDPWGFSQSPFEQRRFAALLNLAQTIPHDTILELGCAEGHFTKLLAQLSQHLTAVDISPTAVAQAKKLVPTARYHVGNFTSLPAIMSPSFNLTVASEVLYYSPPQVITPFLKRLHTRHLLTSNSFGLHLSIERQLQQSGFYRLSRRFLFAVEGLYPKATVISLWEKHRS